MNISIFASVFFARSPIGITRCGSVDCYPCSRFETQLKNTELGESTSLRASTKQTCSLSFRRCYLISQDYQLNKQPWPRKRADSDERTFCKVWISVQPAVSRDWKSSEEMWATLSSGITICKIVFYNNLEGRKCY